MLLALAAVTIFSGPTLTWTDRDVRVGGYSLRQAAIKAVEADEREREKDNAEALSRKDPEQETLRQQIKEHGKPYCSQQQRWSVLSAFAFHHLEGNRVAVRIGLSHGCEAARGSLTQLGILLPIPPALKAPLQAAAARRGGFLMQDAEAISKGRAASLVWGNPL